MLHVDYIHFIKSSVKTVNWNLKSVWNILGIIHSTHSVVNWYWVENLFLFFCQCVNVQDVVCNSNLVIIIITIITIIIFKSKPTCRKITLQTLLALTNRGLRNNKVSRWGQDEMETLWHAVINVINSRTGDKYCCCCSTTVVYNNKNKWTNT